jgi:diguanylate cyclase (GGDEF)-like protein
VDEQPIAPVAEKLRRLMLPSSRTPADALPAPHPLGRNAAATALWEVFPGHVALLDRDGFVVAVNGAWRAFGLARGGSASAGVGLNYLDVCARAAADGDADAEQAAAIVRAALRGGDAGRHAYTAGSESGSDRWFSVQAMPIPGQHSGALVLHTDITAERQREEAWQHRALHDPLTGLPNRALLTDRLEHAVAGAARDPRSIAVLFIDLDGFKQVNDRLGHSAGDEVLRQTALRLAGAVRTSDTIGRWGGDEFLVIAERLDDATTVDDLAARLGGAVRSRLEVDGESLVVSVTIGVADLEASRDAAGLIEMADRALLGVRADRSHRAAR